MCTQVTNNKNDISVYRGYFSFTLLMDTLNVNSTVTTVNTKKVTTHSHIKGLGLKEDGYAEPIAAGFVGQLKAREVFEEFYNKIFLIASF